MIYVFSDLKFDLDRRQLSRDGQPIKLTKLDFKVLRTLVEAAPAVIRHDDLITQVWGENRVITPENLSQRMKILRHSLGDDPNHPRYIEGIRGQGFRLIPEVKVQSTRKSGRALRRTWSLGLVGILAGLLVWFVVDRVDTVDSDFTEAAVSTTYVELPANDPLQQPAIAVLPFANLSGDPSNQYFTDGIHDDLLTRISNIQNIKTISRTSVMTYRGTNKKLGTIAKELGVSTILEGGVQKAGQQVRINLQLIDAESDAHLWASTYTRELTATNVFVIQAEITEAVASALQTILSEDERKQLEKLPTANLEALDAYFKGAEFNILGTAKGVEQAIEAYQLAIKLDPDFSLAYSALALANLEQIWFSGSPIQAQLEKSKPLIDQAILLDPQSSETFRALGRWYQAAGDLDKAEKAFDQALVLRPNNSSVLSDYGMLKQWERSDPSSAIRLFRRAAELDPQNIGIKTEMAQVMRFLGMAGDAILMLEHDLVGHPEFANGYRVLGELYTLEESRHDKAVKALRRAYELDPKNPQLAVSNAVIHWRLGDYENTALWMNHAARQAPWSDEAPVYRSWAYINAGNFENASRELRTSVARTDLYWHAVFALARVDTATGHPQDAIDRYTDFVPDFDGKISETTISYSVGAINAYLALGEQNKARALAEKLMTTVAASPQFNYINSVIFDTSLYAILDQKEVAIAILSEWVNRGRATAYLQYQTGFELNTLANEPRYQQLLQTVNNRLIEQRANLARWEASGEMLPMPKEVSDTKGS